MIRRLVKKAAKAAVGKVFGGGGDAERPAARVAYEPPARAAAPAEPEEPPPDLEINAEQLAAWLDDADRDLLFVDVRERSEMEGGHWPEAWLLPVNQIPQRFEELPREPTIVLYCAAGARSYGAAAFLREKGYDDAWSLVGGFGAALQARDTYVQPPRGRGFELMQPVRLSVEAAAAAGLAGEGDGAPAKGPPGTVQQVTVGDDDALVYSVRVKGADERLHLVSGLPEAALDPIGRARSRG